MVTRASLVCSSRRAVWTTLDSSVRRVAGRNLVTCAPGFGAGRVWITPRVNDLLVSDSKQGPVTAFREAVRQLIAMYDPWSLRDLFHWCSYRGTLPPPYHHWTDAPTPQREMAEDMFRMPRGPIDLFHDRVAGETDLNTTEKPHG